MGINTGLVSSFTMNKTVTMGVGPLPRVLRYKGLLVCSHWMHSPKFQIISIVCIAASVYVPFDEALIQTEGPTAYMPGSPR